MTNTNHAAVKAVAYPQSAVVISPPMLSPSHQALTINDHATPFLCMALQAHLFDQSVKSKPCKPYV